MIFSIKQKNVVYVSRTDVNNPLSAYSKHGFALDDASWPSVEHYYQAMKFEDPELRETIRTASHPADANKIGKKNKRRIRKDWDKMKLTVMTRAIYIKSRTHKDVAESLLSTGDIDIIESSQYDYFWGCGRDQRGQNNFGKILMDVRTKLKELEK